MGPRRLGLAFSRETTFTRSYWRRPLATTIGPNNAARTASKASNGKTTIYEVATWRPVKPTPAADRGLIAVLDKL